MSLFKKYGFIFFAILGISFMFFFLLWEEMIQDESKESAFEITTTNNSHQNQKLLFIHLQKNPIEEKLKSLGLINIFDLDSSILVEIKYATTDNFLQKNLYGDLKHCFLQQKIAEKLVRAQALLKNKFPYYSLIVYDGARPLSVQKIMWNEIKVPENRKDNYVSNPEVGSLHNYGCAIDVSIINKDGIELDMGTAYDYFGILAHPSAEKIMLEQGKLSQRQLQNRILLRKTMQAAGFTPITSEWWHFNGSSLKTAREKYKIIN